MKKYDVVALGAIVVDLQGTADDAHLEAHGIKKGLSNLVSHETVAKVSDNRIAARTPGGPGTSVAAGVALRGGSSALIGKIANDDHGNYLAARLQGHGIEFTPLLSSSTGTTAVLALTTPDRERSFAFAAGASMELTPEDIDAKLIAQAKITYLDSYLWLTPNGKDTVHHAADLAKQNGGKVALALNDAHVVAANQPGFLALATSHADILVGDRGEFMALFKTVTLEETLEKMKALGVTAAITAGAAGAYIVEDGTVTHVPAKTIDKTLIVDTNGAGDQFAAGFLYGLAQGKPAAEAGGIGAEWASDVIRHFGAEPKTGKNAATIQNNPVPPKIAA
ncbi:MAG TPA: adenosine kinase [Patescibacteria group bacterium]|nr:adenosine kinase [Patescibacteria group bacterium]